MPSLLRLQVFGCFLPGPVETLLFFHITFSLRARVVVCWIHAFFFVAGFVSVSFLLLWYAEVSSLIFSP